MYDLVTITDSTGGRIAITAIVLASFGIYKKLNERSSPGAVLMTRLDRAIPFVPAFSVPYLLYIPYLFGIVGYGILATPYYAEIAASALAVQLAAAAIYRIHATSVPRPAVTGNDLFSRLTKFIYRNDRPNCAFPSLHVAYAVLCGYWAAVMLPALLPAVAVFSAAVILSTVFLKQHAVIDAFGGASVAVLSLVLFA